VSLNSSLSEMFPSDDMVPSVRVAVGAGKRSVEISYRRRAIKLEWRLEASVFESGGRPQRRGLNGEGQSEGRREQTLVGAQAQGKSRFPMRASVQGGGSGARAMR
jgi:hypothetical protein